MVCHLGPIFKFIMMLTEIGITGECVLVVMSTNLIYVYVCVKDTGHYW